MDNGLTLYEFQGLAIRVTMYEGQPWFVAKDVGDALGYAWNGSATIKHVPEEWKGVRSVPTPSGDQDMAALTEHGLYFFLGRSDKPGALPFQKWLAGDVLPSIRKHGMYAKDELLDNPDLLFDVVGKYREERRAKLAAEARALAAETKVEEQAPLVSFAETCLASKDAILVREMAKVITDKFGIKTGEKRLYQTLRDWGMVLHKSTEPSQRGMEMGLFEVLQRPIEGTFGTILRPTTKITPRGQVYIVDRLIKELKPVG